MPRGGGGRRGGDSSAEPEAIHELGVRGRYVGTLILEKGGNEIEGGTAHTKISAAFTGENLTICGLCGQR